MIPDDKLQRFSLFADRLADRHHRDTGGGLATVVMVVICTLAAIVVFDAAATPELLGRGVR
ncbi:MAG: hypothetical protein ACRC14_09610 [Paracoccaceae bacterium]